MVEHAQRKGRVEHLVLERRVIDVSLHDADRGKMPRILESGLDRVPKSMPTNVLTP